MNQTFSLARFGRLHRWLWATKGRTYLIGGAAFVVLVLLLLSPILGQSADFSWSTQRSNIFYFFFLALLLTMSIGSDVFSALFRQESAIGYLLLPASKTEKFWLGALYCLVAIVLLGVVFFSYEALVFSIVNSRLPADFPERYMPSLVYHATRPGGNPTALLVMPWTLVTALALALLGSFFFRRGVFVRNVGVALGSAIGLILLYRQIVRFQFSNSDVVTTLPFERIYITVGKQQENLALPDGLIYSLYLAFLVALWVIARLRFTEVER